MVSEGIKDALKKSGIVPKNILPGSLWTVRDKLIVFPEDRLPSAKKTSHEFRTIVVLSRLEDCEDPTRIYVLMAPLSSNTRIKAKTDYLIPKGNGNLRDDSMVRLGLVQPILKTELEKEIGLLPESILEDLKAMISVIFGLIECSEE